MPFVVGDIWLSVQDINSIMIDFYQWMAGINCNTEQSDGIAR
jgi:hypothetical protein